MNTRGIVGLALFLVGTTSAFTISARDTLSDMPWQYMPAATAGASLGLYNATFTPAARGYLAFVDGVGDIQAQAYRTTGVGISTATTALAKSPAVAAVAQWYVDSNSRVDTRLTPQ